MSGAVLILSKHSQDSIEEKVFLAKNRALREVLKDAKGNPLISRDWIQSYLLAQEGGYQITYQKTYDTFLISINGSPFESVRQNAETKFLEIVGGDREIACRFKVRVVTPAFANPALAGQEFPLNFCTSNLSK